VPVEFFDPSLYIVKVCKVSEKNKIEMLLRRRRLRSAGLMSTLASSGYGERVGSCMTGQLLSCMPSLGWMERGIIHGRGIMG
jgi:hypothetical protein